MTTIDDTVTSLDEEGVTKTVMPVTENLLRAILPLDSDQQLELVRANLSERMAESRQHFERRPAKLVQ